MREMFTTLRCHIGKKKSLNDIATAVDVNFLKQPAVCHHRIKFNRQHNHSFTEESKEATTGYFRIN